MYSGHSKFFNLEVFFLEFYRNNKKLLVLGVYKPQNQNDIEFLNTPGKILDHHLKNYENIIMI